MGRRFLRLCWSAGGVVFVGASVFGGRHYLKEQAASCTATSPTACATVKRLGRPLAALRFPGARAALDHAYGVEFDEAARLYYSCLGADRPRCVAMAWGDPQRFQSDLERRRTAEAARRLCERNRASACVALGMYVGEELGVAADRAEETRILRKALELGANYPCRWFEVCDSPPLSVAELKEMDALGTRGPKETIYSYVKNAKLQRLDLARDAHPRYAPREPSPRDPNAILTGRALVLAIRTYDPGDLQVIDDEMFEDVSIEIPSFHLGIPMDLGTPQVHSYFSAGSVPWSPAMGAIYADHAHGSVTVLAVAGNGDMRVRVDASFLPMVTPDEMHPPAARLALMNPPLDVRSFAGEFTFVQQKLGTHHAP